MDYLTVRAAHCSQAMTVREKLGETGIHRTLVIALMFDDLSRDDLVRLRNQSDCGTFCGIIQRVGDLP